MLINRDVIRQQQAVQNFDHTQKLAEYGFSIGTRADIDKAKDLVTQCVKDAETQINELITAYRELDQNPYKPSVTVNNTEVKYALEVPLFDDGELSRRLARTFPNNSRDSKPMNKPDAAVVAGKIRSELLALASDAGFEVAHVDSGNDGSPTRIILRDPDYVRDAMEREPKAPAPPTISDVVGLLTDRSPAPTLTVSRASLGCPAALSAEAVSRVAKAADTIAEEGAARVAAQVAALRNSQLSPFDAEPVRVQGKILYCDSTLVRRSGFRRYVDRPVSILALTDPGIARRLKQLVDAHTAGKVNAGTFNSYVRQELVKKLKAVPGLPLASVSYHYPWSDEPTRVVLTDPALRQRNLLQRLLPWAPPPPKPVLALPPPTPEPPQVIGKVTPRELS